MAGERTAVFLRGDANFAETRKVVDGGPTSDVILISREGEKLTAAVLGAQEALRMAHEFGDQRLIDRADEALTRAVEMLADWHSGADERHPDKDVDLDYFPLSDAMTMSGARELSPDQREQRLADWQIFLRFIFQDGARNPWEAFKNLLAVVRRIRPDLLQGVSQTQLGLILGETKAAVNAREMAAVEDLLKRWGFRGFQGLGGTKTATARRNMAAAAKGNTNRRGGKRKGDRSEN